MTEDRYLWAGQLEQSLYEQVPGDGEWWFMALMLPPLGLTLEDIGKVWGWQCTALTDDSVVTNAPAVQLSAPEWDQCNLWWPERGWGDLRCLISLASNELKPYSCFSHLSVRLKIGLLTWPLVMDRGADNGQLSPEQEDILGAAGWSASEVWYWPVMRCPDELTCVMSWSSDPNTI